ncbi:hypothetical protein GCM10027040_21580 [Halomonas shantousis]
MTVTLIWLIAFALILFLALRAWEGPLGGFISRNVPAILRPRHGTDDRWVWCGALAILGATFIVEPVSMLLTLILLAVVVWVGVRLVRWAMSRVKMH